MVDQVHDVYNKPMQGVDPELLRRAAAGQQAKATLSGMNNSPAMAMALRDYKTEMPEMQGKGMTSTAPNPLQFLASALKRNKGDKRLNAMEEQSAALRGEQASGAVAEMQANLAQKEYGDQQKANALTAKRALDARLLEEKRGLEKTIREQARVDDLADRKLDKSVISKQNSQTGEVVGMTSDNDGNLFRDGVLVQNPSEWITPTKKTQEVTTGSYGGKGYDKDSGGHINTIQSVDRVFSNIGEMTPEAVEQFNDPAHQAKVIAIKALTPEAFEALAARQFTGYPPETQQMLISLHAMSGEERKRLFGSALTKTELSSSKEFLPAVMGRGLDWITSALENAKEKSVDSLFTADQIGGGNVYQTFLTGEGIIPEDYAPARFGLGADVVPQAASTGGALPPEKQTRLEELRAKQKAGTLDVI